MKKLIAILFCAVSFSLAAADWSFISIGFWVDFPPATVNSDVYGVRIGAPISSGRGVVDGVEASIFGSATDNINGIQASWVYNQSRNLNGIQATFLVNRNTETFNGIQASLAYSEVGDLNGLQASFVNIAKSVTGLHGSSLNIVTGPVRGAEFGVFANITGDMTGMQASLVNKAGEVAGIQLGVLNFAKRGGMQFGLLNFNSDAWIPVFPLINFSF